MAGAAWVATATFELTSRPLVHLHAHATFGANPDLRFDPVATSAVQFGHVPEWQPALHFDAFQSWVTFGAAKTERASMKIRSTTSHASFMPSGASLPLPYVNQEYGFTAYVTGDGSAIFSDVNITSMNKTINGDGDSGSFKVPITDPGINNVHEPYALVIILRNAQVYFAGFITGRTMSDEGKSIEFQISSLRSILAYRTISEWPRKNLLQGGWGAGAAAPNKSAKGQHKPPAVSAGKEDISGVDFSWRVDVSASGLKGRHIGNIEPKPDADPPIPRTKVYEGNNGFAVNTIQWTVGESDRFGTTTERLTCDGDMFTYTGWVKVNSMLTPPFEERGLMFLFYNKLGGTDAFVAKHGPYTQQLQYVFVPLNHTTPKGPWVRCQCSMVLPVAQVETTPGTYKTVGGPQYVSCRLYSGDGSTSWSGVYLTWNKRLSYKDGKAQSIILSDVLATAQSLGKGPLPISLGFNGAGGDIRYDTYLFSNHEVINDVLNKYVGMAGGVEIEAVHGISPGIIVHNGTFIPPTGVSITQNDIVGISWETQATTIENKVTVYAEQSSATRILGKSADNGTFDDQGREQGYASVNAPWDLEGWHGALPSSGSGAAAVTGGRLSYTAQARGWASYYSKPVTLTNITVADTDHLFWLRARPGGLISVTASLGSWSTSGSYRIMGMSYDGTTGNTTFNLVDQQHGFRVLG